MDLVYLDLPTLPDDIQSRLLKSVMAMPGDPASVSWLNNFHQGQINAAEMIYANSKTQFDEQLAREISDLYSPRLGNLMPVVGRIRNITKNVSVTPPHCDRGRHVAINYILTTGGDTVHTVMYQQRRSESNPESADNCVFSAVTESCRYVLPPKRWHAFDAQRYHSVHGISTTRIILSLFLIDNPTWAHFIERYQQVFECSDG